MNGDFEATKGSAALYGWYVREKSVRKKEGEWEGKTIRFVGV